MLYFTLYRTDLPHYDQPLVDAKIYEEWARAIVAGDVWSEARGVFYRAPLYPYFLAAVQWIFDRSMPALAWIQFGLGLATIWMTGGWTREVVRARWLDGSRRDDGWSGGSRTDKSPIESESGAARDADRAGAMAALLAMILLTLYGPLVAAETKRLGTTLGLFLLIAASRSLVRFLEVPGVGRGVASGALFGLTALVRPFWLVLIAAAPFLFWKPPLRSWVLRWLPVAAGVAFVVLPVTAHNRVVGDDWVLISSNGGMTLFHGNNIENRSGLLTIIRRFQTFGSAEQQRTAERIVAEEASGRPLEPSETSAFWAGEALRFAREHPGRWLRLEAMKLYRFVTSFEYADNYSFHLERERLWPLRVAFVPIGLILALGVGGWILRGGTGPAWRLAITQATLGLLGCLIFFVSSRYRMEGVPAWTVLGAAGVVLACRAAPRWTPRRRAIAAGAATTIVFAMSLLPAGAPARSQESITYMHLGNAFEGRRRFAEAREAYDDAVSLLPENAFAWKNLLLLTARLDGPGAARARISEIPAETREHPELAYVRGYLEAQTGDRERAIESLRTAVREQPMMREGHYRLAQLLAEAGRFEEAERHYLETIRLDEGRDLEIWRHLLYVRLQLRRYVEARETAERILETAPDDEDARFNLAVSHFYLGDLEDAGRILASLAPGGDPLVAYYQGLIALRRGRIAEAAVRLEEATTRQPENARAIYYGSLARMQAGGDFDATLRARWEDAFGPIPAAAAKSLEAWLRARAATPWGEPMDLEQRAAWETLAAWPAREVLGRFLAEERSPDRPDRP